MRIVILVLALLSAFYVSVQATPIKPGSNNAGPFTAPSRPESTTPSPNIFSTSTSSDMKTALLFDLIGASNGYSNLSIEFKLEDYFTASALITSRIKENDNGSTRVTEVKGFLVTRHITGDFGTNGFQAGLGPLSYLDIDNGELSKGLALAAFVAGQIVTQDRVKVRFYILGSTLTAITTSGLQIGVGF